MYKFVIFINGRTTKHFNFDAVKIDFKFKYGLFSVSSLYQNFVLEV